VQEHCGSDCIRLYNGTGRIESSCFSLIWWCASLSHLGQKIRFIGHWGYLSSRDDESDAKDDYGGDDKDDCGGDTEDDCGGDAEDDCGGNTEDDCGGDTEDDYGYDDGGDAALNLWFRALFVECRWCTQTDEARW